MDPMNQYSLILNDGTILEDSRCGYSDHYLWCWIKGLSFAEVYTIFSNPSRIQTIIFEYNQLTDIYKDFTEIVGITKSENTINVRLAKKEGD